MTATNSSPLSFMLAKGLREIRRACRKLTGNVASPAPSAAWTLLVPPEVRTRLDQIPSETTPRERALLYRFFADLWHGGGNVVEIGPFLGGTTRAIALGMLANPRRDPDSRIYTYDRFGCYYTQEALLELLQPLFAAGVLDDNDREAVGTMGSFREVFDRIHQRCDYGELIVPVDRAVPDLPEQGATGEWFRLPAEKTFDAFFVDGCKSWYGTKYFMQQCAAHARPGSYFLYQDYLWFTCFWIPAFLHLFADHFTLVASVDQTCVFRLQKALSADVIEQRFPDVPDHLGAERLTTIFRELADEAAQRHDEAARFKHRLQLVGALAYIGEKDEARRLLQQLSYEPSSLDHRSLVRQARHSPTYRPGGDWGEPVLLDAA